MNWIQLGLFLIYVATMLSAGVAFHRLIFSRVTTSRALALGEALLLGSILIVGQMLLLSLLHLYTAGWLWFVVGANLLWWVLPSVRQHSASIFSFRLFRFDAPLIIFLLLVLFFMFRNCFFLLDVDSHSTYLFAQKLWLEHKTSIFASPAMDIKIFVPHFNAVPYALGLSIFPAGLLFPQLVVAFWSVIAVLLAFGYLSGQISRWHGLAAAMFILFNDHMFFSGANTSVIINCALVAFIFACAYSFWQARKDGDTSRLVFAFICATQFLSNKYQSFYILILLFAVGLLLQNNWRRHWRTFVERPLPWAACAGAVFVFSLWLVKNFLATGCATFPILAGETGALNWNKEMADLFNRIFVGPLPPSAVLKYFSYMFVWPGINAAKIVGILISFLPLLIVLSLGRGKEEALKRIPDLCFWLSVSVLVLFGICLSSFVDPRHYRYAVAVMAVAAVVGLDYLLRHVLRLPAKLIGLIIVVVSLQGLSIVHQTGVMKYPSIKENLAVLSNKMHLEDVLGEYYPGNQIVSREILNQADKMSGAAWDIGAGGGNGLSAFLLPTYPQVGLWYTTAVKWESYRSPEAIARDLSEAGINRVMSLKEGHLAFEEPIEYGRRVSQFDRHPKGLFYNYGFPAELAQVRY
jgi:hypothetical protein